MTQRLTRKSLKNAPNPALRTDLLFCKSGDLRCGLPLGGKRPSFALSQPAVIALELQGRPVSQPGTPHDHDLLGFNYPRACLLLINSPLNAPHRRFPPHLVTFNSDALYFCTVCEGTLNLIPVKLTVLSRLPAIHLTWPPRNTSTRCICPFGATVLNVKRFEGRHHAGNLPTAALFFSRFLFPLLTLEL